MRAALCSPIEVVSRHSPDRLVHYCGIVSIISLGTWLRAAYGINTGMMHFAQSLTFLPQAKDNEEGAYRDWSYSLIFALTRETIELKVRLPLSAIWPIVR